MNRRNFIKYIGCGCGGFLLNSCTSAPITDRKQLKLIPESKLNAQAAQIYEKVKEKEKLIKSGLDVIIFSFDGGTKKTYEKLRPGRFHQNNFDKVYENIKNFSKVKSKLGAKFPITKIQMILTKDSRNETENFFKLFNDIIDDVTVTQYNERGGSIKDLTDDQQMEIVSLLNDD